MIDWSPEITPRPRWRVWLCRLQRHQPTDTYGIHHADGRYEEWCVRCGEKLKDRQT